MCKFYSAVVTRTGELYHNSFTTSHEDIISLHNLKEGRNGNNICRIEFWPDKDEDKFDYKEYNLHFDDDRPGWFTDELKEKAERRLRTILKGMIITENRELIIGKAVLLKDCKIKRIQNCLVYDMQNSQVGVMWGNSQVGEMWQNSRVGEMWQNSQVGEMWENSRVGEMWGNSQVGEMWQNSRVGEMWENSQVGEMWGNSQVGEMWGNSQVGEMWGNSQVGVMWQNSRVGEMWQNSRAPRKPKKQ